MRARWAQSIGTALPSGVLVLDAGGLPTAQKLALVLLASLCLADLVRREARDPRSPVPIVSCAAVLLVLAVVTPPRFSQDLWSYAFVGRTLTVHHASPYLSVPAAFPGDAFVRFVASEWRHVSTPYGPLFVLHTAVIAMGAGSHPLLYRLGFQGTAAAAVGTAMLSVWRETRQTSALALIGLHPVVACSVVNGGHNDALVGLGLLLAVIAARRERCLVSGLLIAAAIAVKASAALALVPLAAWAYVHRGRQGAREVVAPSFAVAMIMLLVPGLPSALLAADAGVVSRSSIWNLPLRLMPRFAPRWPHPTATVLIPLALFLLVALAAFAGWSCRRAIDPAPGVVAAVCGWLVLGAYVLPWYTVWALPTAALQVRSRVTRLVAVQGVLVTAAFLVPASTIRSGGVVSDIVRFMTPAALVVMFVWALARNARQGETSGQTLGSVSAP